MVEPSSSLDAFKSFWDLVMILAIAGRIAVPEGSSFLTLLESNIIEVRDRKKDERSNEVR
jgi:hypothetical protein